MTRVERLRAALRAHPFLVDSAVAAVVVGVTLLVPHPDALPGQPLPAAAMVPAGVACVVLIARRWRPRATLVIAVLATGAAVALAAGRPIFIFAQIIAVYTVAVRTDRRTTVVAFGLSALVLVAVTAATAAGNQPWFFLQAASGLLTWSAMAAALGDAVRSRRAYVIAIEERVVRAEQSREEEALRSA